MRGIPGQRAHLATFHRDAITADDEGQPVATPTIIWQGRGTMVSDGSEMGSDSAGRPFATQRCTFRCRPRKALQSGDYCELMGITWYVESAEKTPNCWHVHLRTPTSMPFH